MAKSNQTSSSGGPEQANSAYLDTIQSRAIGSCGASGRPKGIRLFGKRRIYQLGGQVLDANQPAQETGESKA